MDKDKKFKHQRLGTAREAVDSEQREQEQNQRSRWASNSKINRILGNLERSILGQFNNNNNNVNNNDSEKSPTKQTIAKRKQIVHQQAKDNGSASFSSTTVGTDQSICSSSGNQTLERSRQSTNGSRVSSTLKASASAKTARETSGKLTLEKCQQQQHTHQQHQHFTMNPNQILATNKLAIPPPHANDEARNMNRSLLFGGGVSLAHANDQSSDVTSANLNVDPIHTVIRGPCPDKSDKPHDDVFCANRVNSSPASSAKSLPAIGPKPRSHLSKQSNNDSTIGTNNEDEESGFETYQSRRSFLLSHQLHQQEQQQQAAKINQNAELNKDKMILVRTSQSTNPPGAPNQLWNSIMINNNVNFRNHHSMQQDSQTQYTQPIVITSNQVPIQPVDARYGNFYPSISQHNSTQNFMPSQHMSIQPTRPPFGPNMTNLCDTNLPQQIHRYSERQATIDNEQHIYANAPPKPRRYQYYDLTQNPHVAMINQMNAPTTTKATMLNSAQPASNSINGRLMNNQQVSYNQPQTALPQMSYQSTIAGHPQARSNLSRLSVPNSYQTTDGSSRAIHQNNFAINYVHQPTEQQKHYLNATLTRPIGHSMVKSKSSLDAGDLLRFRQLRQPDDQSNLNALQTINNRQPIYSSENENSANIAYRHHDPNIFRNMSQVSQLQRSRSVTHLLPEIEQSTMKTNQAAYQDQVSTINRKFTSYASASTNQMNLVGSGQVPQLSMVNNNLISQDSRIIMHRFNQPNNIDLQNDLNYEQRQRQAINNWTEFQRQNATMTQQQQFNKSKSTAAPNNNFSNRVIRNSMGNYHVAQDMDGFTKPSLDDQIKHLLIGKIDSIDTAAKNLEYVGEKAINNNCDNSTTYQISNNNRIDSIQSCSNATKSTQTLPVWANNNEKIVHVTSRQHPLYQQTQTIAKPNFTLPHIEQGASQLNTRDVGLFNTAKLQASLSNNISRSSFSLAEIGHKLEMGNHQQRQYHVQQMGIEQSVGTMARRRQSDANSQLIVDLTTPRVLARTQTTLLAADKQANSDQCWSINQVGLPQFNPTSSTPSANFNKSSLLSGSSVQDNKKNDHDAKNIDHKLSPNQPNDNKEETKSNSERIAPYYYSDLKSEEQRQALMNIVQQKSLSPPPQLLSRSTDQSNTRLGLKSATMQSSHARTLSENLAQRQRALNETASVTGNSNTSWSRKNQSSIKESNSTTNIAKNIDKLFERPLTGQASKISTNVTAQSMLALNDCKEIKDISHLSLDQSSAQHQTESISSGYCSSELRSKNLSKSKSLDNISQEPRGNESSKCLTNPVYENIRCSNKLLTAINDATNCFATNTNSSNMKSLTTTNSDESMDSILGSSLDDSDSGSDIIDEIKISSTDNHLNDISDIIAQLKINHSKLTEEHKATLVRISKTINSRSKQDASESKSNNEKVERRLRLLELKSKKCESRSKNQLALIQMMEKVLRQSKLRSLGNNRPSSQQILPNRTESSRTSYTASEPSSGNQITKAKLNLSSSSSSSSNSHSSTDKENIDLSVTTDVLNLNAGEHEDGLVKNSSIELKTDSARTKKRLNNYPYKSASSDKQDRLPKMSQEIIKAIVTEKHTDSAGFKLSKASIPSTSNNLNDIQQSGPDMTTARVDGTTKDNAVTKKILDIELRNSPKLNSSNIKQGNNPFYSNSSSDDSTDNFTSVSGADAGNGKSTNLRDAECTKSTSPVRSEVVKESSNLMRDEDDFIEFLSNDISGHRSQFEASQFSASDFDTSSSMTESNTSGTANDSISAILSNHDMSTGRNSDRLNGHSRQKFTNANSTSKNFIAPTPSTVGILKKKHYHNHDIGDETGRKGDVKRANKSSTKERNEVLSNNDGDMKKKNGTVGLEKFKNVLGNVIDVDICPMNNLSQCSPVNNQA